MDIIKGKVSEVIDEKTLKIDVFYRCQENKETYENQEKVLIEELDAPDVSEIFAGRVKREIEKAVAGRFIRCDIKRRDSRGTLRCKVSTKNVDIFTCLQEIVNR